MSDHPRIAQFRRFDDAVGVEEAEGPPASFAEIAPRLRPLLDLLPQREAVSGPRLTPWLERTIETSAVRAAEIRGTSTPADAFLETLWHIRRASGIGGSEIGPILRHLQGDDSGLTNARNIVLGKLLVLSPRAGTEDMDRGHRAEPWLRRMRREETGMVSDEAALARLRRFRWSRMPQMAGTPDDLLVGERRLLSDYKCPSADVSADYARNGVDPDYVAQIHHYAILAKAAGERFDDMEIAVFDAARFAIRPHPVAWDPELAKRILATVRMAWETWVMADAAPRLAEPAQLDAERERVRPLTAQAAVLKTIGEDLETRRKEILAQVSTLGAGEDALAVGRVELGFARLDRSRSWNEDELRALAETAGIGVDAFLALTDKLDAERAGALLTALAEARAAGAEGEARIAALLDRLVEEPPFKRKLDAAALAAAIEAAGVSTRPAAEVSERFTLTTKKKGVDYETLAALRIEAADLADAIEEAASAGAAKVLRGDDAAELAPEV